MARKKKSYSRRSKISLSRTAAVLIPVWVAFSRAQKDGSNFGDYAQNFSEELLMAYTGFDLNGKFEAKRALVGWGPVVAAKGVSYAKRALGNPSLGPIPVTL